ncbi:hypothetical protein QTP88_014701 [Uroleucon formosanum]
MSSKKPSGSWFTKQRLKKEKESKKLTNNINKWLISETINANNVVVAPPEIESPGISSNPLDIPKVESVPPELKPSGISSNHLNISEVESEQINNVDYCIENNQIDINCDINFNDPGTWPPITSSTRTLLVEKGPQHYEPKNVPSDDKELKNCRAQGYDNGSNMAGKYNGVQAVICRKNELATFMSCAAHSLNRIGVHAAEKSPTMVSFFGTVQKVFNIFSSSVSKWEKLTSVLKVTLKSHSDTCWSSKKRAVSAINQHITQVYEILQCMSNNESLSVDTIEGAKCLLCLFNLKIFILLDIWDLILT